MKNMIVFNYPATVQYSTGWKCVRISRSFRYAAWRKERSAQLGAKETGFHQEGEERREGKAIRRTIGEGWRKQQELHLHARKGRGKWRKRRAGPKNRCTCSGQKDQGVVRGCTPVGTVHEEHLPR